jgi:hypothetical protein
LFVLDLECGLKTIPVRCLYNNCQNQGICHVDILKKVSQCVCPSGKFKIVDWLGFFWEIFFRGFAGDQCQYAIDECQSNPCPIQSQCIDLPNSYTCVCGMKLKN